MDLTCARLFPYLLFRANIEIYHFVSFHANGMKYFNFSLRKCQEEFFSRTLRHITFPGQSLNYKVNWYTENGWWILLRINIQLSLDAGYSCLNFRLLAAPVLDTSQKLCRYTGATNGWVFSAEGNPCRLMLIRNWYPSIWHYRTSISNENVPLADSNGSSIVQDFSSPFYSSLNSMAVTIWRAINFLLQRRRFIPLYLIAIEHSSIPGKDRCICIKLSNPNGRPFCTVVFHFYHDLMNAPLRI